MQEEIKKAATLISNCLIFKWCHQEMNTLNLMFLIRWWSAFFYFLKLLKPLNQPYINFFLFQ